MRRSIARAMKQHPATLSFLLLALAHADWARLAFSGGLALFAAALAVEAATFALLAIKSAWLRPLAAVAIACELAGIAILGVGGMQLLYNLVVIAGLALLAWRATLAPGAYALLAGYALFTSTSLLAGETFLLLGLALCVVAWATLSWIAFVRVADQPSVATSVAAQAGGRP